MNKKIVPTIKTFSMLTEDERVEMLTKAKTETKTALYVMPSHNREVIRYSFIKIEGENPKLFLFDFRKLNKESNYDDFFDGDITNIFKDAEERPMNSLFSARRESENEKSRYLTIFGENYRNPAGTTNKPAESRAERLHSYDVFYDEKNNLYFPNEDALFRYIITGHSSYTVELLVMALRYSGKSTKTAFYRTQV